MPLVGSYEIVTVEPYSGETSEISVIANLDACIGEALPYLNAAIARAVFNPGGKTLTFKKEGMTITLLVDRITVTKLRDLDHAHEELKGLLGLVNDVWERRGEITPSFDRRAQLTALQVYKGLPATNCKECGEPSCLAFAAKVLSGETSPIACRPLLAAEFQGKRSIFVQLLTGAGYEVPPELKG
jgi:ArsR family metal-binding transcriptional regulator